MRKPTLALMAAIAETASTMLVLWSSRTSSRSGAVAATVARGRNAANSMATKNKMAARLSTYSGPSLSRGTPGTAAANAMTPASRASFELASTSSASDDTVVGTSALLVMM